MTTSSSSNSSTKRTEMDLVTQYVRAIAEAIRDAGPDGIPSGHLYAICMNHLNIDQYTHIINCMVTSGLITNKAHVLTWVPR